MANKHTLTTLPNGLRLVTVPMPQVRSLTVLVMVSVGGRYEAAKISGISHFFEHMVFKGTKKRPRPWDITRAVDSIGAEYNAFTSEEYTGFYIKSASKHLEFDLEILSDMLFNSRFDEKEIEQEKGVIIEEINMYNDMPMYKVALNYGELLYKDSPLSRLVSGTKESVSRIKRQDFLAHQKKWYRAGQMVIGIAGDTSKIKPSSRAQVEGDKRANIKDLVQEYFGKIPEGKENQKHNLKFKQDKPRVHLETRPTEQAHFCLGVRTFKRTHKDRYALAVLATILGGSMSSRMFVEVRVKRGLAYYVKSDLSSYYEIGDFVTQAGVRTEKIDEAIKVVADQYYKIQSKVQSSKFKVLSEELNKAKEYLKGRLILGLEDSKGIASLYVDDLLLESKIRTLNTILQAIDRVTIDDVIRLANTIFKPNNFNLAVVGPYEDQKRFEKLL